MNEEDRIDGAGAGYEDRREDASAVYEDRIDGAGAGYEDINSLVASTVARTAVKTLMYLFVLTVLFMTIFSLVFPYEAMKIYRDFGNDERARECIVMQLSVTEAINSESTSDYRTLYYGQNLDHVNLTIKMLNDAKKVGLYSWEAVTASGYVVDAVTKYLSLKDNNLRSAMVDEFNLKYSDYKWHANLYGFDSYIRSMLFKAKTILDDQEYIDQAKSQQMEVVNSDTIADIAQVLGYLTMEKGVFDKVVAPINTDKIENYLLNEQPKGVVQLFYLRTLIEYREVFKQEYRELATKYAELVSEYGSSIGQLAREVDDK